MNARKILEIKALCQTICSTSNNESTNNELKVLFFVDEYQSISPQILVSKLGIAKSNLALMTKKMISDNLIYRQKSETDGRAILLSITPKGKKMLDDYLDKIAKIFPDENIELAKAMDIVLKNLNKKV